MKNSKSLEDTILAECEDDYVGLWSIIRDVEDYLHCSDELTIRDETLAVIEHLLTTQQIEAGMPDADGRGFCAWPLPTTEVVDRIRTSWKPAGPRPDIGEIVWFNRRVPDKAS
jgi:hypothetical protein